jgi:hypothetical protein
MYRGILGLKPGGIGEKTLYYEYEGEYKPPHFCVARKTKEAGVPLSAFLMPLKPKYSPHNSLIKTVNIESKPADPP